MKGWLLCFSLFWLCGCQSNAHSILDIKLEPLTDPAPQAHRVWPVLPPLGAPDSLRPCCAFGFDLKAQLWKIPVPFYKLGNIVEANRLGQHHYNDSPFEAISTLTGLSSEKDGLVYTQRGGFIDLAHLRDSADNTVFLFSQIWPRLGQEHELILSDELGQRHIKLFAFTPPTIPAERYTLAAYLAAHIAFELAAWHEIAQWYGYQSVPGFSEGISAFSPEDLYSNLLGTRLAISLINAGHIHSLTRYSETMQVIIPQALYQLGAVSATQTKQQFKQLDGSWWNSHCRVPEKFLVLHRNYRTDDDRVPTKQPGKGIPSLRLQLPQRLSSFRLNTLGELQIWPGSSMKKLPLPARFYTYQDFQELANYAQKEDEKQRILREYKSKNPANTGLCFPAIAP